MKRLLISLAGVALVVGAGSYFFLNRVDPTPGIAPRIAGAPQTANVLVRGEYLAKAADCVACHTAKGGGTPFAGGLEFKLPFGKLYAPNITPEVKTGIGAWTDDQFVRAMHDGRNAAGERMYPAFPYTSYTQLSRGDILAIKAYLFSLAPVSQPNKEPELAFPFNQRWAMGFWNAAFFKNERFEANPAKSAQWNSGAYMAVALAHCAECHTPRNIGFALELSNNMAGEVIQGWKAPNITADRTYGLGSWTNDEVADYLMKGHAPGRGSAGGPMAEVVENSLQYMQREDIDALVIYLRDVPAKTGSAPIKVDSMPPLAMAASRTAPANTSLANHELGMRLFSSACASCHQWNGGAQQVQHAALLGARSANDPEAANVMQMILQGVNIRVQGKAVYMPSFAHAYTDTEIAAISNFVVQQYGNKQGHVTPSDVAEQRKSAE